MSKFISESAACAKAPASGAPSRLPRVNKASAQGPVGAHNGEAHRVSGIIRADPKRLAKYRRCPASCSAGQTGRTPEQLARGSADRGDYVDVALPRGNAHKRDRPRIRRPRRTDVVYFAGSHLQRCLGANQLGIYVLIAITVSPFQR
jgi:hypothetical protein